MDNYNPCPGRELLCSKNLTLVSTRTVIIVLFLQLVGHPSFSQPSRIAPDRQHISEMERSKGDYYEAKGDYVRMLPYLQQALSISQAAGAKRVTADIFSDLGQFHLQTKEYEKAREEFNKAYELAKEMNYEDDIALQDSRLRSMRMEISLCALATIFLSILVAVLYRSRIVKEQNNCALKAKNLEIAEQNKRIERQAADLRHNNSQKDQLFSIIAHDLKGPLNSLKSLLDLLKKRSLSEVEIAKTINSLKNNVDNSADLVNNLLYWARSQMNGIEASPVLLQAEPLAAAALNLFAMQAAEKSICLENKLDNDFAVYADKDMVQLVFRNTVSNAIKFCKPGDRITIEGGASIADLAEICVTDTGTGIREEVLEKLNNRKSVTTAGTSAELGTGLGLMLCQEFVEKNGGHFRLQSTWGKGTRICFALPVRPPRAWTI